MVWTFGAMSKQKYTNSDPQIKQENAVRNVLVKICVGVAARGNHGE